MEDKYLIGKNDIIDAFKKYNQDCLDHPENYKEKFDTSDECAVGQAEMLMSFMKLNKIEEEPTKTNKMKTGIELIAEERLRQINVEGWTPEHDSLHDNGQLSAVAASYALAPFMIFSIRNGHQVPAMPLWPNNWEVKWWKPTPNDRIRELQKAGALIAAEIDRINGTTQSSQNI
jgi:hypothetical protein